MAHNLHEYLRAVAANARFQVTWHRMGKWAKKRKISEKVQVAVKWAFRRDAAGCGAVGDASRPDHRWWELLWFLWGVALATLIHVIDGNAWASSLVILAGLAIGKFSPRAARVFFTPFHEWYQSRFGPGEGDEDYWARLLAQHSGQFSRHTCGNDLWITSLSLAPVFGVIHGTLAGPICGALAALDPKLELTATQGALLGELLGPPVIATTAAGVLAALIPSQVACEGLPRWKQHCLLLVSPVFFLPATLHAVRHVLRTRGSAA